MSARIRRWSPSAKVAAAGAAVLILWLALSYTVFRPEYAVKRWIEAALPYGGPLVSWGTLLYKCAPEMLPEAERVEVGPAKLRGLVAAVPVRVHSVTPSSASVPPDWTVEYLAVWEFGWKVDYRSARLQRVSERKPHSPRPRQARDIVVVR